MWKTPSIICSKYKGLNKYFWKILEYFCETQNQIRDIQLTVRSFIMAVIHQLEWYLK